MCSAVTVEVCIRLLRTCSLVSRSPVCTVTPRPSSVPLHRLLLLRLIRSERLRLLPCPRLRMAPQRPLPRSAAVFRMVPPPRSAHPRMRLLRSALPRSPDTWHRRAHARPPPLMRLPPLPHLPRRTLCCLLRHLLARTLAPPPVPMRGSSRPTPETPAAPAPAAATAAAMARACTRTAL